jgi:hypothetical protein
MARHFNRSILVRHFRQGIPAGRVHGLPGGAYRPLEVHPLCRSRRHGELYDLRTAAFEMNNLIAAPGAQAPLKDLKAELQRLLKESQ